MSPNPTSPESPTPVLRWRDADNPGSLYQAADEAALVAEMWASSHDAMPNVGAYMALVARRADMYMDGQVIRTSDPAAFVADCVKAHLLEAVWVHGLGTDAVRCSLIPHAHYLTVRVATLPRSLAPDGE